MPGLVPGIHVLCAAWQGVDGRDKPGHNDAKHQRPESQRICGRHASEGNGEKDDLSRARALLLPHEVDGAGAARRMRGEIVRRHVVRGRRRE